jgi:predicted ATPase
MEALAGLPSAPERDARELDVALQLGLCCIAAHGYAAKETRDAFERAVTLSEAGDPNTDDRNKEIQALFGLWGHFWMRARHDRAMVLGDSLLEKGRRLDGPVGKIVGHRALGSTLFTLGRFVDAREHLETSITLCEGQILGDQPSQFAVEPKIASLLVLAWDLWILGYPDQALERVGEAVAAADHSGHPYEVSFAHYVMSAVHLLRREASDSLRQAENSLAVSTEHHINLYALYARFGRGCALAEMGRLAEGAADIAEGLRAAEASKLGYMRAFMLGWQAVVAAREGDEAAAHGIMSQAMMVVDDVAGRAWEAELYRLRGEILLAFDPNAAEEASESFTRAVTVARDQGARSLELRATTSLAESLRGTSREQEGRDRLAAVYGWFSEGFETADLMDARALIE